MDNEECSVCHEIGGQAFVGESRQIWLRQLEVMIQQIHPFEWTSILIIHHQHRDRRVFALLLCGGSGRGPVSTSVS